MSNSELKRDLSVILAEKQEKIIPGNIKKDVTIFGVTGTLNEGIDTSDATATSDDLISPKTAYAKSQKVTGNIIPEYGEPTIEQSSIILSNSVKTTLTNPNTLFFDFNEELRIAAYMDGTYLYICKAVDNAFTIANRVSYSTSQLGISSLYTGMIRFFPTKTDSTHINFVLVTAPSFGVTATYSAYIFELNITDLSVVKKSTLSSFMSYSRNTENNPSTLQFQESIEFIDNNTFVFAKADAPKVGYRNCQVELHMSKIIIAATTYSMSVARTSTPTISGSVYGCDWDTTYPKLINSYRSGNYIMYTIQKNYRDGLAANMYYISVVVDCTDLTTYYKDLTVDNAYVLCNGKTYYNNAIYDYSMTTSQGSTSFSCAATDKFFVIGRYIFIENSAGVKMYYQNDDYTLSLKGVFTGYTKIQPDRTSQSVHIHNTATINLLESTLALLSFVRKSKQYYDTSYADGIASNLLSGKKMYNGSGKITGTMPNNASLTYIPNETMQSIPQGYTSGGSVAPITYSQDYIDCKALADNILADALYQELEYIESTGTQYIDTGIYLTNLNGIYVDIQLTTATVEDAGIMGQYYPNSLIVSAADNNFIAYYNKGVDTSKYVYIKATDTNRNTFAVNYLGSKQVKCNTSVVKTYEDYAETFTNTETAKLLAANWQSLPVYGQIAAKLYGAKISNNTSIIHNYVPVKRITDGVIGVYDKIAKVFLTNAGTGTFIAGPAKEV